MKLRSSRVARVIHTNNATLFRHRSTLMSNSSTDQPNIQSLWMEWSFDEYYLMFTEAGESSSPASAWLSIYIPDWYTASTSSITLKDAFNI
jgi:hypothetical protein